MMVLNYFDHVQFELVRLNRIRLLHEITIFSLSFLIGTEAGE